MVTPTFVTHFCLAVRSLVSWPVSRRQRRFSKFSARFQSFSVSDFFCSAFRPADSVKSESHPPLPKPESANQPPRLWREKWTHREIQFEVCLCLARIFFVEIYFQFRHHGLIIQLNTNGEPGEAVSVAPAQSVYSGRPQKCTRWRTLISFSVFFSPPRRQNQNRSWTWPLHRSFTRGLPARWGRSVTGKACRRSGTSVRPSYRWTVASGAAFPPTRWSKRLLCEL